MVLIKIVQIRFFNKPPYLLSQSFFFIQGVISEEECFQFFTASLDEVDEAQEGAEGENEVVSNR